MKKFILLFALLFSFTFYAQNVEYMTKIRNLNENSAVEVAQEIANLSRGSFEVAEKKATKVGFVIVMVRSGIDYANVIQFPEKYIDDTFTVSFVEFYDGQNKALEIDGIKKYKFHRVVFNYLDLFPFWQKYFSSNSTLETTIDNIDLKRSEYKNKDNHWLYKFQPVSINSKRWELNKFY